MKTIRFALWTCLCGLGLALFAGCGSKEVERTTVITNTVTNFATIYVTNEVIKEVPKEVEKIVTVPAQIPDVYQSAMVLYQKMTNATLATPHEILFKIDDVRVDCSVSDDVKAHVSEDEIRAKFELTLRHNGIKINPNSQHTVGIAVDGFYNDSTKNVITYVININAIENQWVFHNGDCRLYYVPVWNDKGYFGYAGLNKISGAVLEDIEKKAEVFANDYLAANPNK